jgi:hypothetical protein
MPKKRPDLEGNNNKKKPEPAPIPTNEERQPAQEDVTPVEQEYTNQPYFFYFSYYIDQATKDYNRHYAQVKNNNPRIWIRAWYNDMRMVLDAYSIEETRFVNDWLKTMNFNAVTSFEDELGKLELFFSVKSLPSEPIELSPGQTIADCRKFVDSHIATLRANDGNSTFLPYMDRLQLLRSILLK